MADGEMDLTKEGMQDLFLVIKKEDDDDLMETPTETANQDTLM